MSVGLTVPVGADLTALLRECGYEARMEGSGDAWSITVALPSRTLTIVTDHGPINHNDRDPVYVLTDAGREVYRGRSIGLVTVLHDLREGTPTS